MNYEKNDAVIDWAQRLSAKADEAIHNLPVSSRADAVRAANLITQEHIDNLGQEVIGKFLSPAVLDINTQARLDLLASLGQRIRRLRRQKTKRK